MHLFRITIFVFLIALTACNSPTESENKKRVGSVVFSDTGVLIGTPKIAVVAIRNDSMEIDTIQGNQYIYKSNYDIPHAETEALWQIIENNQLRRAPDPVLSSDAVPSLGRGGIHILFKEGCLQDSIVINRSVRSSSNWTSGLKELLDYKDTLIKRHQNINR